jgi:hypothetical protein
MYSEILSLFSLVVIFLSSPHLSFYDSAFLILVSACIFLTWKQYRTDQQPQKTHQPLKEVVDSQVRDEASRFNHLFLTVYCLVMASDWLQGTGSLQNLIDLANCYRSVRLQFIQRPIWTQGRIGSSALYNWLLIRGNLWLLCG